MAKPKSSQFIVISRPGPKAGANKALADVRHCAYCRRMKDATAMRCQNDGLTKSGSEAESCELFFDSRRFRATDMKGAS